MLPESVRLQITSSSSGEKELVHLHGERPCFGLPFSLPGGLLPQLAQILATHAVGQLGNGFLQCAVLDQELEMHFRLAAQTVNSLQEGLAIGSYRASQSFIGIKDGAKTKRKNGEGAEAFADDSGVVNNGLLGEGLFGGMIADNDREVSAGIGQYRGAVDASEVLYRKGAPGSGSILKALLLSNTVRVPRHLSLSWEYSHTTLNECSA